MHPVRDSRILFSASWQPPLDTLKIAWMLQMQKRALQSPENLQAVRSQKSKSGELASLLISLHSPLGFFKVWRLYTRPGGAEPSQKHCFISTFLFLWISKVERKQGSKEAPSDDVHQGSVLWVNWFTADWWYYLFNSHWALKTYLVRIIGLRNIYTVRLPKGHSHARPCYAKCYTNSNFNPML